MDLFQQAARKKFRFMSSKGALTVEQLWDLPLQSRSGFDLDSIAKAINAELKAANEESFVNTTNNPTVTHLQAQLELVKYIIQVKLEEGELAKKRAERATERQRLTEILHSKKDEALAGLSVEDIEKRLAELS